MTQEQSTAIAKAYTRMLSDDRHHRMYGTFDMLSAIKTLRVEGEYTFSKFIPTGDCEFYDYGLGFHCVRVWLCDRHVDAGMTQIRICFSTCDDGDFGGWSKPIELDKAKKLIAKIVAYFNALIDLPSTESMNENLRKFGIQVGYE